MTDRLGRGIYLDQTLDFDISSTGDIRNTGNGSNELQKDLAFQLKIVLSPYVGEPLTPNNESEIKSDTVDTLLSDNRVRDVDRSTLSVKRTDRNTLSISTVATTAGGEQELIFRV